MHPTRMERASQGGTAMEQVVEGCVRFLDHSEGARTLPSMTTREKR
jgi:hypothetical protein